MLVRVSPGSSFSYYAFYLSGLEEIAGPLRLRFDRTMPLVADAKDGLALELDGGQRLFIAANDGSRIDPAALAWSDVYGIVNHDAHSVPGDAKAKVVAIGPSFGVRWRGQATAIDFVVRSAIAGRHGRRAVARLRAYTLHQRQRLPLSAYAATPSDPRFVFYAASFWHRHPEANTERRMFLRTMRELDRAGHVVFEGGFAPPGSAQDELATGRSYSHAEYLSRMQRSAIAFNTPAVHGCLGWKLGEYLALGKAIVSTPLARDMPAPLEHGRHAHFVEGSPESIRAAVVLLTSDDDYRRHLEREARSYWEAWLTPDRVVRRLLDAVG